MRLAVFLSMFAAITLSSQSQYLLPITKDEPTKQFYTTVNIGAGGMSSPVNLLLDLGTNLTWLNCRKIRLLSSLRAVSCKSSTCKSIPGNGCDVKNTCLYTQPRPLGENTAVATAHGPCSSRQHHHLHYTKRKTNLHSPFPPLHILLRRREIPPRHGPSHRRSCGSFSGRVPVLETDCVSV